MRNTIFVALFISVNCYAQVASYPERPVRFVVANPPGGTTDLIARLLSKNLAEKWGQSIVIDNRAGGGGLIGTELVAKAAPDGYTVIISAPAPISTNVVLFDRLPYDPLRDLTPISLLVRTPSLLLVGPAAAVKSVKTVKELIAQAKSRPGKLSFASAGLGNPGHLQGAMFAKSAAIDIVHIPYKGTGPALNELLGGQVEMMFNTVPAILPLVKANRLTALAITSGNRSNLLPEVPTMTEAGFPNIGSTGWYGVLGPAKIQKAMLAKLHGEFKSAINSPEVSGALVNTGGEVVGSTPQEFSAFIRSEIENARQLISTSGAKRN